MQKSCTAHELGQRYWRCSRLASVVGLLAALTACGGPSSQTAPSPPTAPSAPSLATLDVEASVIGGQTARGTATLTAAAPQGGVVILLATDNTAVMVPSSVIIPGGATSASFEVVTGRVRTTTEVTIVAQAGDLRRTASLRLRIDPASVKPTASYTVGFSALRDNRAPFTSHVESGFIISTVSGPWMALTSYGNPQPFIQYTSPMGVTTTGEISITAGGEPFWLSSVDLYSSTTRIPYVIEGSLSGEPMFTVIDVIGNTSGSCARRSNPRAGMPVDIVLIRLSNPSAPCCSNPMGIDNIILNR